MPKYSLGREDCSWQRDPTDAMGNAWKKLYLQWHMPLFRLNHLKINIQVLQTGEFSGQLLPTKEFLPCPLFFLRLVPLGSKTIAITNWLA